jgi:hypothetical protein
MAICGDSKSIHVEVVMVARFGRNTIDYPRRKGVKWHVIRADGLTHCKQDLERPTTSTGLPHPTVYYDGVLPPPFDRCQDVCEECEKASGLKLGEYIQVDPIPTADPSTFPGPGPGRITTIAPLERITDTGCSIEGCDKLGYWVYEVNHMTGEVRWICSEHIKSQTMVIQTKAKVWSTPEGQDIISGKLHRGGEG